MGNYRYVFGPVPSRRLGRSLGVDLTPGKDCSFNCVFCQVGPTNSPTLDRHEYVPIAAVIAELEDWVRSGAQADFITLSGSGEPTIHSRFGDVLDWVRQRPPFRSALLSNGSTFFLPEVRESAARADVVKISLSAWDRESFHRINRPCAALDFDAILAGYRDFRKQFAGQLWLEVFLVPGLNTRPENVRRIAQLAHDIRPDRVQLNTAVRPPAKSNVQPLPEAELHELAGLFSPPAEPIAAYHAQKPSPAPSDSGAMDNAILALLQRHPATSAEIAATFTRSEADATAALDRLLSSGQIKTHLTAGRLYFMPT